MASLACWAKRGRAVVFFLPAVLAAGCQAAQALPMPDTTVAAAAAPPTALAEATPTYRLPPPIISTFTPGAAPGVLDTETPVLAAGPDVAAADTPVPPAATPVGAHFPYPANATYWSYLPVTLDCTGRGTLFRSEFPSSTTGSRRSFHAYVPDCYGQDGRVYPVLYLIHGSIQTDSHWPDLGVAQHLDAAISNGAFPPFIVIMPISDELGNKSSGGEYSIEGVTVNDLLPYIDYHFCTWAEAGGRSIGGISRGGYWALEIAFRHPELFGAVSGHSSQLDLATDSAVYNPLFTYAAADLSQLRIWLDWGEADFLRAGQEELARLLAGAGIEHETHMNPGGHNEAYWAAHLDEYLAWHAAGWPLDREAYPFCERG
jgi:enterochelin esterase-like enzyme